MGLTLEDIERLFVAKGERTPGGGPVTHLEHALQAAHLAEREGGGEALVVAAFLHDIGHLINDQGETPSLRGIDDRHESVALPFLRDLFGPEVLQPIRLHVEAKRYLCARGDGAVSGAGYWAALPIDSRCSLELQGGIMSDAEAEAFRARPFAAEGVRVRIWDDRARVHGTATPSLAHFMGRAARVAARR
jgi:phosphonate degradation associated HDIG domain protein